MSSWLQISQEIKILNHVSKFSLASETNVVSIIIAGHGPLWQVFRLKTPSTRTQKVILNEILYYICESWYEPFQKYASRSPGWFKNYKQWQLYRYVYWEQYEIINWILTNLSVVICSAMSSCTIVYFATCAIDSQLWGYILNILRNIIVIVLHGLKFLFSLQVLYRQFYGKSKTMEWCQIILSVI